MVCLSLRMWGCSVSVSLGPVKLEWNWRLGCKVCAIDQNLSMMEHLCAFSEFGLLSIVLTTRDIHVIIINFSTCLFFHLKSHSRSWYSASALQELYIIEKTRLVKSTKPQPQVVPLRVSSSTVNRFHVITFSLHLYPGSTFMLPHSLTSSPQRPCPSGYMSQKNLCRVLEIQGLIKFPPN